VNKSLIMGREPIMPDGIWYARTAQAGWPLLKSERMEISNLTIAQSGDNISHTCCFADHTMVETLPNPQYRVFARIRLPTHQAVS